MRKVISLDWLSFSYKLALTYEELAQKSIEWTPIDNYSFEFLSGTKIFEQRLIVRDLKGVKKMTILFTPKSSIIDPTLCLVELANSTLYSDEWKSLFLSVQKMHAGNYNAPSRIDIACDFDTIGQEVAELFNSEEIYVQRKKEGSSFFDFKEIGGRVCRSIRQFSFGSKTSKLKWKLYNKSLELQESHKNYIAKSWRDNHLDQTRDIWRLEVSMVRCSSFEILDTYENNLISLSCLVNGESYLRLFPYLYCNNFVVRKNEGRATNKKHPNSLYNFLELSSDSYIFSIRQSACLSHPDTELFLAFNHLVSDFQKSCIKFNFNLAEKTYTLIVDMLTTYNLKEYLFNVFHLTIDDLSDMLNNPNIVFNPQNV